jgi:hypothetical protein
MQFMWEKSMRTFRFCCKKILLEEHWWITLHWTESNNKHCLDCMVDTQGQPRELLPVQNNKVSTLIRNNSRSEERCTLCFRG